MVREKHRENPLKKERNRKVGRRYDSFLKPLKEVINMNNDNSCDLISTEKKEKRPSGSLTDECNVTGVDHTVKPCRNTSTESQCNAVLEYLKSGRALSTIFARETLGIPHPAGRVKDLRKRDYKIETHWVNEVDSTGVSHRVANYILPPETTK